MTQFASDKRKQVRPAMYAMTATITYSPCAITGTVKAVVELLPSWPWLLLPQHHNSPVFRSAHV